ncbi:MAG: hypothetical protein UZ14_CFX002002653 [Chloroflexi bacterium OLB14]|nr:MAG: hypothetical protein UZ14_CFX002002653 [Chloroflexi bacterium OLB14]
MLGCQVYRDQQVTRINLITKVALLTGGLDTFLALLGITRPPSSLFPIPYSLFPIPYSLLIIPHFLLSTNNLPQTIRINRNFQNLKIHIMQRIF